MKIAIGADHRGHEVFGHLCDLLTRQGHTVEAIDTTDKPICDYPDVAWAVATRVASRSADRGILVCGSGLGMSIAANKVDGVRAAPVHDEVTADMSRRHNDTNVLCLAADMLGQRIIDRIVQTWLSTPFDGGRHARRISKIASIEQGVDPATQPAGDNEDTVNAA
jgi:ribose 5-phosphate isomerase B